MTLIRALSIIAILIAITPSSYAHKTACTGSYAERQLTLISGKTKHASQLLAEHLESFADQTGSSFAIIEVFHPDRQESFDFKITHGSENFVITVSYHIGSRKIIVKAVRACLSDTAEGWESVWAKLHQGLNEKGFLSDLAQP